MLVSGEEFEIAQFVQRTECNFLENLSQQH